MFSFAVAAEAQFYTFATLAGNPGIAGSSDGAGNAAEFIGIAFIATDKLGNAFVTDVGGRTIRRITPYGVVTTVAGMTEAGGTNDGWGGDARFNDPMGIAADVSGNLYVSDMSSSTIRKITPVGSNWVVTTLAGLAGSTGTNDGVGSEARFFGPSGIAVDKSGNIFVAESYAKTIRMVTPSGVVTTLAGQAGVDGAADGVGSVAQFNDPYGVAVDDMGNLYVSDYWGYTIRKIMPEGTNWVVSTLAGLAGSPGYVDGTNTFARFDRPAGIALDGAGNLFVADLHNDAIRKVAPSGTNWVVSTVAGRNFGTNDGTGYAAAFSLASGVAFDGAGNLYVTDAGNYTIRRGFPANGAPVIVSSSCSGTFADGVFGFNIAGPPGQTVVVQVSTNLDDWLPVSTNIIGPGALPFSDPATSTNALRFYRTVNQ